MTLGTFVGGTNYSAQTFGNLKKDLSDFESAIVEVSSEMTRNVQHLAAVDYWSSVQDDFQRLVTHTLKFFFATSVEEIGQILKDLDSEVRSDHITRLATLGKQAIALDKEYGKVWNQYYEKKDYASPHFYLVDALYKNGREMVGTMVDIGNLAIRLNDFVGAKVSAASATNIGVKMLGRPLESKYSNGNILVGKKSTEIPKNARRLRLFLDGIYALTKGKPKDAWTLEWEEVYRHDEGDAMELTDRATETIKKHMRYCVTKANKVLAVAGLPSLLQWNAGRISRLY